MYLFFLVGCLFLLNLQQICILKSVLRFQIYLKSRHWIQKLFEEEVKTAELVLAQNDDISLFSLGNRNSYRRHFPRYGGFQHWQGHRTLRGSCWHREHRHGSSTEACFHFVALEVVSQGASIQVYSVVLLWLIRPFSCTECKVCQQNRTEPWIPSVSLLVYEKGLAGYFLSERRKSWPLLLLLQNKNIQLIPMASCYTKS